MAAWTLTSPRPWISLVPRRFSCIFIVTITLLLTYSNSRVEAKISKNPYQILGVAPGSTEAEIQKAYRKQCLRYHPDKHTQKPRLRKKYEELFKEVQEAYAQIKHKDHPYGHENMPRFTQESATTSSTTTTSSSSSSSSSSSPWERAFREFHASHSQHSVHPHFFYSRSPYQVFSLHQLFSSPTVVLFPRASSHIPSIYVQKINIPLQDLYRGVQKAEFPLHTSWWRRHVAAWRGGSVGWILIQALMYALPVLRWSRIGALALAAWLYQQQLPPAQTNTVFHSDIKAGYKGGTKLTFTDGTTQAVFVLVEETHPLYRRQGDDLHVTKYISREDMMQGTRVLVEPLDPDHEEPMHLTVEPGTTSTRLVSLPGRGWPNRRTGQRGHLFVHIIVQGTTDKKVHGAFWERT